jgi:hypothetical protein
LGLKTALDDIPARPFPDEPDLQASNAKVITKSKPERICDVDHC